MVSMFLLAITSPVRASELQPAKQTCCCSHMTPESDGNNCCGEPIKSQGQQCCSSSGFGMSLLPSNSMQLVFRESDGEKLVGKDVSQLLRTERPPVPPPRLTVVA
jgi:hypothetical protein